METIILAVLERVKCKTQSMSYALYILLSARTSYMYIWKCAKLRGT